MKDFQVIVVGGGFSGVAAAVAAARRGAKVLLVEKANCLGGAAVNNLVLPFMPFKTKCDGQWVDLSAGFFKEFTEELQELGAIDHSRCYYDTEYLKLYLNRVVLREKVSLLLRAELIGCEKDGDRITAITLHTKAGNLRFTADCFIDATGDGDLSAMAGVPFELGRTEDGFCQPMTLCFRVGNVDMERFEAEGRQKLQSTYRTYKAQGKINNPREDVLYFHTPAKGVIHFNTTRICKRNPIDAWDLNVAELEAREQVFELMNLLKTEIPGFEDAVLMQTASEIGVRESRRIVGEHQLTAQELKDCTVFADSIAVGNYDIDIHSPTGEGTSHYYFPEGAYYTIPYRSLLPREKADNLIVAGRCISATHEAQASIRIMPICTCLGEAAGEAAALAVANQTNPKDVPIKELQSRLMENGAKVF